MTLRLCGVAARVPWMAALSLSVPQLVKMISLGIAAQQGRPPARGPRGS